MPVGFSYAMVEAALVELHGIAPDGVPALRSRFGAFQRGGLLGKQPGRGARLQYGPDELHRVVLAFELTQAGMSPTTVLWLVRHYWDKRLRDLCLDAERANVRGFAECGADPERAHGHGRPRASLSRASTTRQWTGWPRPCRLQSVGR